MIRRGLPKYTSIENQKAIKAKADEKQHKAKEKCDDRHFTEIQPS